MKLAAQVVELAVVVALACPLLLCLALALSGSPRAPHRTEALIARLTHGAMLACFSSLLLATTLYAAFALSPMTMTARTWFSSIEGHFHFDLLVDGWSLAFALFAALLSGTVAAFSSRYLHLEQGFRRFFSLYALFVFGVLLIALAGSVEVLFAGWELLGLSSALLVGFFHDRRNPVSGAFRVFVIYRISDAALLIAAVVIHHALGSGSLAAVFATGDASALQALPPADLTLIGLLILTAVAAKSALVPFSGWLPRAMEGPTPSSAIFYGGLSVHAGCYLLWRAGPLIEQSPLTQALTIAAGAVTALYAAVLARVQTDVKSALSYATLTQVGLIVVEIALGWRELAFVHMLGNATLRLVQFLTASNALQDMSGLEIERPPRRSLWRFVATPRVYVFALERGGADALVDRLVVRPFLALMRSFARVDRLLAGERKREAPPEEPPR